MFSHASNLYNYSLPCLISEYDDEAMLIPRNASVIVRRVPGVPRLPIVIKKDEYFLTLYLAVFLFFKVVEFFGYIFFFLIYNLSMKFASFPSYLSFG